MFGITKIVAVFFFVSVIHLLQLFVFDITKIVTIFRFYTVLQKIIVTVFFSFLYYICFVRFCITSICFTYYFTDSFHEYVLFLSFRNVFAFDSG